MEAVKTCVSRKGENVLLKPQSVGFILQQTNTSGFLLSCYRKRGSNSLNRDRMILYLTEATYVNNTLHMWPVLPKNNPDKWTQSLMYNMLCTLTF